jgi:hypothetical protein
MTGAADAEDQRKPHGAQVEAMAGYGVSVADIAQVLGIEVETLKAATLLNSTVVTSRPMHALPKVFIARPPAKDAKPLPPRSSG